MSIAPDFGSSHLKQYQVAVENCSDAEDDIDVELENSIRKSAKNEVRRMSHKICNSFLDTMKQQEELELKIVRSAKNEVRRMSQKICAEFLQQLESQDLLQHEIEKSAKAEVRRMS
jgi:signal transduction histidine kinase